MLNRSMLVAVLLAGSPCVLAQQNAGQCEANFTVAGSWSSGKTFKTSAEHAGVGYDVAFDKVAAAIRNDGLTIIDESKERGFIRANNPVKGGQGGTAVAPMRVLVIGKPGGAVKVDVTFTIAGGQLAPKKAMIQHLCAVADAPAS